MLFLLPVLSGLLLFASFPRIDQGYLAWAAFIPAAAFLWKARGTLQAFCSGLILGFIQAFGLMTWMPVVLVHYGGLPPALAWIAYSLLAAVLACYPAAACALSKYLALRGGDRFFLLFPALWVLSEFAQSVSPFGGLPWLTAGYSQSRFPKLIQIADVTGVYGLSFILVWTGVSLVWLYRRRGHGVCAWLPPIFSISMIAVLFFYGQASMNRWDMPGRYRAAMLQQNISYDEPYGTLLEKFQSGYIRMADRLKPGKDLLILPESPSPVYFETNDSYRQGLEQLAARFPFGIVFNNVRSLEKGGSSIYFNSAYFMNRRGIVESIYDKIHLVPFGEYIPLKHVFSFIETISKDVGSFEPGANFRIAAMDGHPVNAVVCFEAVFPDLVRKFARQGSELIINLTNDSWYGDSAAPYQHLAIARFRAVENRRFLLRATNSGISAVIDPGGRIRSSTGILQEAICEGGFDFIAAKTFYTRYGDVFVLLCAIISCALAPAACLRSAGKKFKRSL